MIKAFQSLVIVSALCVLASCAHAPVHKEVKAPEQSQVTGFADSKTLSKGGDLALVPFNAGEKAEANDETDRLAMMILKGIKDSLDQNNLIHVVDASQTHPKFGLQGYIQEFSKPGKLSKITMRHGLDCLSLEGEMWEVSTGQRVAGFSVKQKFDPHHEKPIDVAYRLGQGIGRFIIEHTKKEE